MIFGANGSRSSEDKGVNKLDYSFSSIDFGPATLSITPPPGMVVKLLVYRGGEVIKTINGYQYSFELLNNDNYRFVIQYAYDLLGSLGITSDPSGVRFRMKGPTGRAYTAVSPKTFINLPAGSYSLYFPATDDCYKPAVKTVLVEPGKRNTTKVTFTCEDKTVSDVDTSRPSRRTIREYAEKRETNPRGERK